MAFKPEDMISDEENFANIQGISIRKGSFAALLANAEVLSSPQSSIAEKQAAKAAFAEIIPKMVAIGAHKFIAWKNPELQSLMENATCQENIET